MKYFLYGKQITKEEAEMIEKQNQEYLASDNLMDWLKCIFVLKIYDGYTE